MTPSAPRIQVDPGRAALGRSAEADDGETADVGDPRTHAEVADRVEEVGQVLRDLGLGSALRDGLDGLVGHLAGDAGDLLNEVRAERLILDVEVAGVPAQAVEQPAIQLMLLDVHELDCAGRKDRALLSLRATSANGQSSNRVWAALVLDGHVATLVEGLGDAFEVRDVQRDLAAAVVVRDGDAVASSEGNALGHGDPFLWLVPNKGDVKDRIKQYII